MRMILNLVALAFLAFVPAAMAELIKHPATGLQIELPAGWKTRTHAGQLVAEPPDRKSQLTFSVIEEANIPGYVEKWAAGMQGRLTDLQVDVDDEVNEVTGLQQIYSVGSATLAGKPIQWDLTIVKGGNQVLAVMALGENLDGDTVQKVYASIQRVAPGGRPVMKGEIDTGGKDPNSAAVYLDEDDVRGLLWCGYDEYGAPDRWQRGCPLTRPVGVSSREIWVDPATGKVMNPGEIVAAQPASPQGDGDVSISCWYEAFGPSASNDQRCPPAAPPGTEGVLFLDPATGKPRNYGTTEKAPAAAPPPLRPAQAPPSRVAEEPVAEEPAAEQPVAEEPVADEAIAEEPAEEEPVAEVSLIA